MDLTQTCYIQLLRKRRHYSRLASKAHKNLVIKLKVWRVQLWMLRSSYGVATSSFASPLVVGHVYGFSSRFMKYEKPCSLFAWLFFPHTNFSSRGCMISKLWGQNAQLVFKRPWRSDLSIGRKQKIMRSKKLDSKMHEKTSNITRDICITVTNRKKKHIPNSKIMRDAFSFAYRRWCMFQQLVCGIDGRSVALRRSAWRGRCL
jgi:hypothetical protein